MATSPFKITLVLGSDVRTAEARTAAGAFALVNAFQKEHCTNKDALASIWQGDVLSGGYIHRWQGGVKQGPKDTRHPLEKLFRQSIRAGKRVTIIGEDQAIRFNHETAGLCDWVRNVA